MIPSDFFAALLPAASTCKKVAGIPISFTLAQGALESGWGSRAPGNNLFGVKADSAWHGATVDVPTHEVIGGKSVATTCKFRAYPSWIDCIADHAKFFQKNPRYAACFHEATGEGWARAVAAAGYATDPKYADKIISVIRSHNLAHLDL